MRREIQLDTAVKRSELAEVMGDLDTYPYWLDVAHHVEAAPAVDGDPGPAWFITLRAELGRFARSKRLRVVRTANDADHIRFERHEADDRNHSAWIMDTRLDDTDDGGSTANLTLSYEGGLWSGVLDTVLGDQIGSATERLPGYLAERQTR